MRVFQPPHVLAAKDGGEDEKVEWTDVAPEPKDSTAIHDEISTDNERLRASNKVEERFFDVEVSEPLLKEIRSDTKLVLVDIPGINEAGSKSVYKDWVDSKWDTFDAVILVMDATKGVNTEEQVQLLELVQANNKSKKDIPVFILGNKVDDCDNQEQKLLVSEMREKIQQISAKHTVEACVNGSFEHLSESLLRGFCTFIPVSAELAYIYRSARSMDVASLKKFDPCLIEKIGHDEVGRFKWRKLTEDERLTIVYDVICDAETYQERLDATNFDTFLNVFSKMMGRKPRQLEMIRKQEEVALRALAADSSIVQSLAKIQKRSQVTSVTPDQITSTFWNNFKKLEGAMKIHVLLEYEQMCKDAGWKEHSKRAAQQIVREQKEAVSRVRLDQNFAIELTSVCLEDNRNYLPITTIINKFWDLFNKCKKADLQECLEHANAEYLKKPLDELLAFHKFCASRGNTHQQAKVGSAVKALVKEQAAILIDEATSWDFDAFGKAVLLRTKQKKEAALGKASSTKGNGHELSDAFNVLASRLASKNRKSAPTLSSRFQSLSPRDWVTILTSFLVAATDIAFLADFLFEKQRIMQLASKFSSIDTYCTMDKESEQRLIDDPVRLYRHAISGRVEANRGFVPFYPKEYANVVTVALPSSIEDPCHWGHLVFQYTKFMHSSKNLE